MGSFIFLSADSGSKMPNTAQSHEIQWLQGFWARSCLFTIIKKQTTTDSKSTLVKIKSKI
jgi:hypothetical protein